jgi:hypothetical protein
VAAIAVVVVAVLLLVGVTVGVGVLVPVAHGCSLRRCGRVDARASLAPLCAYERTHAPVTCARYASA